MARQLRGMFLFVAGATLAGAAFLAPGMNTTADAEAGDAIRIVLETRDDGYGCVEGCDYVDFSDGAWRPALQVPQGAMVDLGFVWAHEAYPYEEHIMVIDAYGLESDLIDRENRETSLQFIASEAGSFTFKCDVYCDLHAFMQRATVRVGREGGGGAAPQYTPTLLDLDVASRFISGLEPVELSVALTAEDGEPLERAEVRVYVDTEFGGVRDLVHTKTLRTDESGVARFDFAPFTEDPDQRVVVRFGGMGIYDEAEQELSLQLTGAPPPVYTPEESRLESVKQGARIGAGVGFVLVWGALGFVFIQALRIGRARGEE
jgi:hypothetical protein